MHVIQLYFYFFITFSGVYHNPSKKDVRPPNSYKMKVHGLVVTFQKRPLDGLWFSNKIFAVVVIDFLIYLFIRSLPLSIEA